MSVHFDMSVIMPLHSEGRLAHRTFKALHRSVCFAEARGKSVEVIVVMDSVEDKILAEIVEKWRPLFKDNLCSCNVNFGSLSLSRNHGISRSRGDFISLLDGDDLYGEQWLFIAHNVCSKNKSYIAHPQFVYAFPIEPFLRHYRDSKKILLNLLFENQWSPLVMAHKDIFLKIPYVKDDETYGYEDWLWNSETGAAGYTHILAPETLMAIRQKPGAKSLWQNSFMLNKVVRPNNLFRKLFLQEYGDENTASPDGSDSDSLEDRLFGPLIRWGTPLLDYTYIRHPQAYQAIIHSKRAFATKFGKLKGGGIPGWVREELESLSLFEPTLRDFENPQVRLGNTGPRVKNIITPSMTQLVKAEKPAVYILKNIDLNDMTLKALSYMRTQDRPVFLFTTDKSRNPCSKYFPPKTIHIDIGSTGLIYEERLLLMHRLLLEAQPDFIHVFDSMPAMDMFHRYPRTFHGIRVYTSFFTTQGRHGNFSNSPALGQFSETLELFHRVSSDSEILRNYLMDVFTFSDAFVDLHPVPFTPWLQSFLKNISDRHGTEGTALRILFMGVPSYKHRLLKECGKRGRRINPSRVTVDFFDRTTRGSNTSRVLSLISRIRYRNMDGAAPPFPLKDYHLLVVPFLPLENVFLMVQAMGHGIPVITLRESCVEEIITEDRGWFLGSKNDPSELLGVIRQCLKSPRILREKSMAAERFVGNRHSWENFQGKVANFYGD